MDCSLTVTSPGPYGGTMVYRQKVSDLRGFADYVET